MHFRFIRFKHCVIIADFRGLGCTEYLASAVQWRLVRVVGEI